ncbi:hypothetical protein G6F18_014112 [Rhizopus arrhizus]|nr:hypothetical protein G6F18_014112 [Rhizopus arrhizus]
MAILNKIGVNRQGFSLLLCSHIYATFVRPKFEYGLAISRLTATDLKSIEGLQDRCLRLLVGGHRTSCAYYSLLSSCPLSSCFLPAATVVNNASSVSNQDPS